MDNNTDLVILSINHDIELFNSFGMSFLGWLYTNSVTYDKNNKDTYKRG